VPLEGCTRRSVEAAGSVKEENDDEDGEEEPSVWRMESARVSGGTRRRRNDGKRGEKERGRDEKAKMAKGETRTGRRTNG
jgi:hypothetical protein